MQHVCDVWYDETRYARCKTQSEIKIHFGEFAATRAPAAAVVSIDQSIATIIRHRLAIVRKVSLA